MSLDVMKQALEALERGETKLRYEAITALRAAIEQTNDWDEVEALRASLREHMAEIHRLRAAIEQATRKQSLQVPPEVVDSLTTTDIAWLATHRLTNLWIELGQTRWAGADKGWDLAIDAVRNRINDECQSVLDWKAQADQSQATAIELLQKMQSLENGQ